MKAYDLRNLTVSLLKNHTDAGSEVFNSKATPTMPNQLPAMAVYFRSVEAHQQSRLGVSFIENGMIEIDVMVASSLSWADTVDSIIDQIKDVLFTSAEWLSAVGAVSSYSVSYHLSDPKLSELPMAFGVLQINITDFNYFNPT